MQFLLKGVVATLLDTIAIYLEKQVHTTNKEANSRVQKVWRINIVLNLLLPIKSGRRNLFYFFTLDAEVSYCLIKSKVNITKKLLNLYCSNNFFIRISNSLLLLIFLKNINLL